jgi:hypothetical protein
MFFVIGSFWFWLLVVVAYVLITICLEYPRWGGSGATLIFILSFAALWFWGGTFVSDLFSFIADNKLLSILMFAGYFLVGIVWSFVKWYFYLLNCRDKISAQIESNRTYYSSIPTAKDNKGRIISWMTYWPMSIVWTIFNDPIKRMCKYFYQIFESWYQGISNKVFADIKVKIENKK